MTPISNNIFHNESISRFVVIINISSFSIWTGYMSNYGLMTILISKVCNHKIKMLMMNIGNVSFFIDTATRQASHMLAYLFRCPIWSGLECDPSLKLEINWHMDLPRSPILFHLRLKIVVDSVTWWRNVNAIEINNNDWRPQCSVILDRRVP